MQANGNGKHGLTVEVEKEKSGKNREKNNNFLAAKFILLKFRAQANVTMRLLRAFLLLSHSIFFFDVNFKFNYFP